MGWIRCRGGFRRSVVAWRAGAAGGGGGAGGAAGPRAGGGAATGTARAGGAWRRPETGGEPDDALDLGATVLPILLRTYWRQLAGAVLVILLLRRLLGGRKG